MYENNPLAFIVEQAGGVASHGSGRTLETVPESLHERGPLFIGSTEDVRLAEEFLSGRRE